MQIGVISIVILSFFFRPHLNEATAQHEFLEQLGLLFVLACILGRLWSILYLGGKKNIDLVTSGPYSMTRNPLYLYSTLGAFGIGLEFGSVILALLFGGIVYAVFSITALKEAAFLRNKFGAAYEEYSRRTPFFWPNVFSFRDIDQVTFSPKALKRAFFDAIWFWSAFPLIEALEYAHMNHHLPTLFTLY